MNSEMSLSSVLISYENLIHAVSGALGSTVALSVFYPLDIVRTHQQVRSNPNSSKDPKPDPSWVQLAKDIIAQQGVSALYNGLGAVNRSVCVSNFVYFYAYHALKRLALNHGFQSKPLLNLSLGMLAGTVNVLATTPLWVANTRIKLQGSKIEGSEDNSRRYYKGLVDCMTKIAKEEGVEALWSGTLPSLILVFNPAIHWAVYEALKANLGERSGIFPTFYVFVMSAIAKCVASVTTYPLQLLQNRLRAKLSSEEPDLKVSIVAYFRNIVHKQGPKGLFYGLEVKLWQTVLTAAFMFVIYEKVNAKLLSILLSRNK